MKKLLLLFTVLLCINLHGQIGRFPFYVAPVVVADNPEMINNGTFDNTDDWNLTLGGGWSITGGVAVFTAAGGAGRLRQGDSQLVSAMEVNTEYTLEFDLTKTAGDDAWLCIQNFGTTWVKYVNEATYTAGHKTIVFTTPSSIDGGVDGGGITFLMYADGSYTIDNVSLKKN